MERACEKLKEVKMQMSASNETHTHTQKCDAKKLALLYFPFRIISYHVLVDEVHKLMKVRRKNDNATVLIKYSLSHLPFCAIFCFYFIFSSIIFSFFLLVFVLCARNRSPRLLTLLLNFFPLCQRFGFHPLLLSPPLRLLCSFAVFAQSF